MKCFWFLLFVASCLAAFFLWEVRTGVLDFGRFYSSDFKKGCMEQFYLPYPPDARIDRVPSHDAQRLLMVIAYNVSVSNCSDLGPFPLPPGATESIQIDGSQIGMFAAS